MELLCKLWCARKPEAEFKLWCVCVQIWKHNPIKGFKLKLPQVAQTSCEQSCDKQHVGPKILPLDPLSPSSTACWTMIASKLSQKMICIEECPLINALRTCVTRKLGDTLAWEPACVLGTCCVELHAQHCMPSNTTAGNSRLWGKRRYRQSLHQDLSGELLSPRWEETTTRVSRNLLPNWLLLLYSRVRLYHWICHEACQLDQNTEDFFMPSLVAIREISWGAHKAKIQKEVLVCVWARQCYGCGALVEVGPQPAYAHSFENCTSKGHCAVGANQFIDPRFSSLPLPNLSLSIDRLAATTTCA